MDVRYRRSDIRTQEEVKMLKIVEGKMQNERARFFTRIGECRDAGWVHVRIYINTCTEGIVNRVRYGEDE